MEETPILNEHNKQEYPPAHNGELDVSQIRLDKMKGKNVFTQKEINELKRLITLRVNSTNKSEKKKLRDNMRKIGFYGRDDFGIFDCKVSDLERLIKQGRITVVDYKSTNNTCNNFNIKESANKENIIDYTSAEKELTEGEFKTVSSLSDDIVPDKPGIYCIKLQESSNLPSIFGKIRKDRIIYIGKATISLKKRLWQQELNHKTPATFFRSIGAMLDYLPPKGSLVGKKNKHNYKFSKEDTDAIKKWMKYSLRVNYIILEQSKIEELEDTLIRKYMPLVNLDKNPQRSIELEKARKRCVEYANSL